MYIPRQLEGKLRSVARSFPVVALVGPRQSGKTTLARHVFSDYEYLTLENFDIALKAKEDPRSFLSSFDSAKGLILDEFQKVPELLSYLQGIVDENRRPGFYILTGSQNFLMNEAITQTLAGRIYIATLLPLSISELSAHQQLDPMIDKTLLNGFYPGIYSHQVPIEDLYPSYIQTYVERDVRQIKNVSDLNQFQRFMRLCAGRTGQLLNYSSLANDCEISVNTAKSWISLLEASYIIFLLHPYYKNYSKRLIKSPKLFFYDPGLVCNLIGISTQEQLFSHYLRGGIFESTIIANYIKYFYNHGERPNIHFWQNKTGNEVDCVIERGLDVWAIEIKSGMTIQKNFFEGLTYFQELADQPKERSVVVYAGKDTLKHGLSGSIYSWRDSEKIFSR